MYYTCLGKLAFIFRIKKRFRLSRYSKYKVFSKLTQYYTYNIEY